MGRVQWPESRRRPLISPALDAVSGRSYGQSSQTAGALGGRRAKAVWFIPGPVTTQTPLGPRIKVTGGVWRPVAASARFNIVASGSTALISVVFTPPGESLVAIFSTNMRIFSGDLESVPGAIVPGIICPIGSILSVLFVGGGAPPGNDLTIELDYIVRAVGQ